MKRTACLVALPVLLAATSARAEGFFELVGGALLPLGDEDYEDQVNTSPKIGLRAGVGPTGEGLRVAFELGVDYAYIFTASGEDLPDNATLDVHRVRALAGGRVAFVSRGAALFFRAGAGIDYASAAWSYDLPIIGAVEGDDDDLGVALEVGGGVTVPVGPVGLGAQVALPIAFHEDDEDPVLFDYDAYDLDVLFTVSTRW